MFSIISELDPDTAVFVMHLWRKLSDACGLKGIYNFPNPHFTWLVADSVETKPVCELMAEIAKKTYTFPVRMTGINVFEGHSPVLYLSLFKSLALAKLHLNLLHQVKPFFGEINKYYSPEHWIPHVTLALRDLTNETLDCAVKSIEEEATGQMLWVNNIMLVQADEKEQGETLCRVELL